MSWFFLVEPTNECDVHKIVQAIIIWIPRLIPQDSFKVNFSSFFEIYFCPNLTLTINSQPNRKMWTTNFLSVSLLSVRNCDVDQRDDLCSTLFPDSDGGIKLLVRSGFLAASIVGRLFRRRFLLRVRRFDGYEETVAI